MRKKLKKVTYILFSIIAISILCIVTLYLYNVYTSLTSIEGIRGEELIKTVSSPDGKYEAKVYLNNGGATVDDAILVTLVDLNTKEQKNIYWNYPCDDAQIEWISDKKIKINDIILNISDEIYDYREVSS